MELNSIIDRVINFNPSNTFLINSIDNASYSYEQVYAAADIAGKKILADNYREIIISMDNSIELVVYYFAALFNNLTIIPIDPEKSNAEIDSIKALHPYALFISEADLDMQAHLNHKLDIRKLWNGIDFEKPYLITFTSGSTGTPKGVIHSAKNLFLAAQAFGMKLDYCEETILAHVMPMTYMAGILNSIFLPFIFGGKIVVFPRFSVKSVISFWKYATKFNVNTFWLSPTMLRMISIIDRKSAYKDFLHKVNATFSIGTAPLDNTLRNEFERKYEIEIFQSYGLSETLFLTTENKDSHKNSSGDFLNGIQYELMEQNELSVKTPWNLLDYENTAETPLTDNGFYKTGDMVEIVDGSVFITGRTKDLIIKGGYNIRPKEIADLILENTDSIEVEVVGVLKNGEEVIACAYTGNKELDLSDINKIITEKLGKHANVSLLLKIKEMPKNLNGKIDRIKLKEYLCS